MPCRKMIALLPAIYQLKERVTSTVANQVTAFVICTTIINRNTFAFYIHVF